MHNVNSCYYDALDASMHIMQCSLGNVTEIVQFPMLQPLQLTKLTALGRWGRQARALPAESLQPQEGLVPPPRGEGIVPPPRGEGIVPPPCGEGIVQPPQQLHYLSNSFDSTLTHNQQLSMARRGGWLSLRGSGTENRRLKQLVVRQRADLGEYN